MLYYWDEVVSQLGFVLLWWNTTTKSNLGRKDFFPCKLLGNRPPLRKIRNSNGTRTWKQKLLTGLLNLFSYSAQNQSATQNELGPPSSLIKKMPYQLAYNQTLQRHFLIWGSLLSDDYSFCQVDIKVVSMGDSKEITGEEKLTGAKILQRGHLWVLVCE